MNFDSKQVSCIKSKKAFKQYLCPSSEKALLIHELQVREKAEAQIQEALSLLKTISAKKTLYQISSFESDSKVIRVLSEYHQNSLKKYILDCLLAQKEC